MPLKKNSAEYREAMAKAVRDLKVNDPQKFAELQKRARDADYDGAFRAEESRKLKEAAEQERFARVNKPMLVGLPDIDMFGVRGLVAYRTWAFDGRLKSTAMPYHWKDLNFADRIPDERNQSGFYCIKLSSLVVMTTGSIYFSSLGRDRVSGFVELLGRVVEHTDGILRAEVVRLICLFVTSDNGDIVSTVRSLYENYIAPVYILNPEQLTDVIFREVLRQKYCGGE